MKLITEATLSKDKGTNMKNQDAKIFSTKSQIVGWTLSTIAGVFFTLYNSFFKAIQSVPLCELVLVEGVFAVAIAIPFIIRKTTFIIITQFIMKKKKKIVLSLFHPGIPPH